MTDKQLIKITTQFTKGIIGKRNKTDGYCFMVSAALQSYLNLLHGMRCELIEGEIRPNKGAAWNHFWLELEDGRILDPTADQFKDPDGSDRPMVYIGKKPKWYIIPKFTKSVN